MQVHKLSKIYDLVGNSTDLLVEPEICFRMPEKGVNAQVFIRNKEHVIRWTLMVTLVFWGEVGMAEEKFENIFLRIINSD